MTKLFDCIEDLIYQKIIELLGEFFFVYEQHGQRPFWTALGQSNRHFRVVLPPHRLRENLGGFGGGFGVADGQGWGVVGKYEFDAS